MIYVITATYTVAGFIIAYTTGMAALTAWERGKAIVDSE